MDMIESFFLIDKKNSKKNNFSSCLKIIGKEIWFIYLCILVVYN